MQRDARGAMTARLTPSGSELPRWWLVQVRMASGVWSSTLVRGQVRAVDGAAIEGPVRVMRRPD